MQNRVTLVSVVLLVCICSTWATHYDMMVSSTSKMCRKFHFSYISSPCLTNITSKSDSTSNFDLGQKKKTEKSWKTHCCSRFCTTFQTFFRKLPRKCFVFGTPFFSRIEPFWTFTKNFPPDKIFWNVKYEMWNVYLMCDSNWRLPILPPGQGCAFTK